VVVLAAGCGGPKPEVPQYLAQKPDTSKIEVDGDASDPVHKLAVEAIADLQDYWGKNVLDLYGKDYEPVEGGFYAVTPSSGDLPPCVTDASEIWGNAFYCATKDVVAWDAEGLLPDLQSRFGDFVIPVVLAHESGHAVQGRSNFTARTVTKELQADCFAGAWSRHAKDDKAFDVSSTDLDKALAGILEVRDTPGTGKIDPTAHGSGFDRVSAFQDGFDNGLGKCKDNVEVMPSVYEQGGDYAVARVRVRPGARVPGGRDRRCATVPGVPGVTNQVSCRTRGFGRSGGTRDGCLGALPDPRRDGASHVGRAGHGHAAVEHGVRPADVTAPDPSEGQQAGLHRACDLVPGVDVADVGGAVGDHQPPSRRLGRHSVEPERHRRARPRPRVDRDGAVDVPHQQVRIEVLLAELADPAGAPRTQRVDDARQLLPAGRQRIGRATVDLGAIDHADPGQRLEASGQQRRRHLRYPAPQFVEVPAAE
jgi:predicted metalloprotease